MTDLFFDDDVTDDDVLDHGLDPVSTHDSFAVDKSFASAPLQLFGVDDIERRLVDFINQNRLPHGLIFSGPRGVGKASVAMRLARTLLAHIDINPVDNGPGLFGDEPAPVTKLQALDIPPTHPVAQRVAARSHLICW